MSKKGNSDGLCNTTVGKYFQKRKVGEFVIEKMSKKGNFDGLYKLTVGIYFQKRKVNVFVTGKICPKKEILIAYVSGPWKNISKKGKSMNFLQKNYVPKRKF